MNGAHDHPWEGRDRHYKGERRRSGRIKRARQALKNVLDRICGEPDTMHSRDAALTEDPRYDDCPRCIHDEDCCTCDSYCGSILCGRFGDQFQGAR